VDIQYGGLEGANPIVLIKEILPSFDECAMNASACEYRCVDGATPSPGYTCEDPSCVRFPVTEIGMSFFSLMRTVLPQVGVHPLGFRMITLLPPPSMDATYVVTLDQNLDGRTLEQVLPGFTDLFAVLIQPLDPSRVQMSFVQNTFVIHFNSPEFATVRWTGPYKNNTGFPALKLAIYQVLKLNPDDPANHNLFDPEYNLSIREVMIYFYEDLSLADDPSYRNRSCTFAQALFTPANRALIEDIGFKIEGAWRMPETDPNTCSLVDPNDFLAPLKRNDGSLQPWAIGVIITVIVLVVIIIILIIVVVVLKKKGWKKAPTVA